METIKAHDVAQLRSLLAKTQSQLGTAREERDDFWQATAIAHRLNSLDCSGRLDKSLDEGALPEGQTS